MGPMGPMGPQNPYAPPYAPPPAPSYEYEFDATQNASIASAALWARILGIALIVVGAAALINCNVIEFALNLVIGIYFLGGASSLSAVVNTQGNDIAHMMQALSKLGAAFKVRVIMTLVAVGLLVVCGLGGLMLVFLSAASSHR